MDIVTLLKEFEEARNLFIHTKVAELRSILKDLSDIGAPLVNANDPYFAIVIDKIEYDERTRRIYYREEEEF